MNEDTCYQLPALILKKKNTDPLVQFSFILRVCVLYGAAATRGQSCPHSSNTSPVISHTHTQEINRERGVVDQRCIFHLFAILMIKKMFKSFKKSDQISRSSVMCQCVRCRFVLFLSKTCCRIVQRFASCSQKKSLFVHVEMQSLYSVKLVPLETNHYDIQHCAEGLYTER